MSRETLSPDPDAVEKWEKLPQNKPSKQALPPLTGGLHWTWWLIVVFVLLALVFVVGGRPG